MIHIRLILDVLNNVMLIMEEYITSFVMGGYFSLLQLAMVELFTFVYFVDLDF